MANSLGQLIVRLGLDAAEFTSGLSKSEYSAKKFADSLSNKVAIGIAKAEVAIEAFKKAVEFAFEEVPHLIEQAGHFQDIAEKAGGAAEKWASFNVAAQIGGTNMDAVASASVKLSAGLSKIDDQSKGAGLALKTIGISLNDIKGADPATQIQLIAKALAGFEDGAGKTAVAVALFGKAGAEMLPFLKELGEGVGAVSILTREQIAQADEWADHHAKAKAMMTAYAQVLAIELIPSLNAVTEAVTDVIKQFLNLDGAAGELKASRAILDWAETAALAIATVVEAAVGAAKAVRALAGSFEAVWADIKLGAQNATPAQLAANVLTGDFAKQLAERNRTVEAANKRYVDLWNYNGTAASDAIRKSFDHQKRLIDDPEYRREFERMGGNKGQNPKKKLPVIGLLDDDAAKNADAAAKKLLDGQVKAVRDFAEQQKAGYDFANQYLKGVYDSGVTSLSEFFADQKALRDANLQDQLKALDAEIQLDKEYLARPGLKPQERVETEQKIADAVRRRAAVVQDAARKEILAQLDVEKQVKQTAYSYYDFLAQVANLKGDTATASSLKIAKQVQDAQELLRKVGFDPAQAKAQADAYGDLLQKADALSKLQTDYGRLVEHTGNAEKLAQLAAQESGAGEIETLTRIAGIRQDALASMSAMADRAQQLAQALGTPEAQQFAERLTVQLREAAAAADPVLQKVRDIGKQIGDNFASNVTDAITAKGKTIRERVLGIFEGLGADITKAIVEQKVSRPLADWVTNLIGGNGQASGGGGFLGSLFGFDGRARGANAGMNTPEESFRLSEIVKENFDGAGLADKLVQQATATATVTTSMASLAAAAEAAAAALQAVAASGGIGGGGGLGGLFNLLGGAGGVSDTAFGTTTFAEALNAGVIPVATGGLVTGPGSGTSDSIAARLSNGEFVVNAEATKRFQPLLEVINSGKALAKRFFGGNRAIGGATSPWSSYEVNERGPEILDVNGRQFLMMGAQRGQVVPLAQGGGGGDSIHVTVSMPPGASRQTAMQWGSELGRHLNASRRRNGKS